MAGCESLVPEKLLAHTWKQGMLGRAAKKAIQIGLSESKFQFAHTIFIQLYFDRYPGNTKPNLKNVSLDLQSKGFFCTT